MARLPGKVHGVVVQMTIEAACSSSKTSRLTCQVCGCGTAGAIAKSGIWVPELKQYYAAVPKHLVELLPKTEYGMAD